MYLQFRKVKYNLILPPPLPPGYSLVMAVFRVYQEVWSQLVLCSGSDGGVSPVHLRLLAGKLYWHPHLGDQDRLGICYFLQRM